MRTIRNPRRHQILDPQTPQRSAPVQAHGIDDLLMKVQKELMPERAQEIVAINTETGEFTLGLTFHEACESFRARWPHGPLYVCRVDGGPGMRMYGRS